MNFSQDTHFMHGLLELLRAKPLEGSDSEMAFSLCVLRVSVPL